MASFEFLAIILTGLGLTVSILYYTTVLQNANKTQQMALETRQAQLFSSLQNKIDTVEFRRIYRTIKYDWGTKPVNEVIEIFEESARANVYFISLF